MLRPPIEPMLAKTVHALPEPGACAGGCVFEPKFDGFRAIVFHQPGEVFIQSRAGRPLHRYFPDVADIIAAALPAGVVLDGELIIWAGGRTSFTLLQRRLGAGAAVGRLAAEHSAHLVLFDLLQRPDGTPLLKQPLAQRREELAGLLDGAPAQLPLCPQTTSTTEARVWVTGWAAAGVEGLLAKGGSSRYLPGRRGWLKYRATTTTEAIVAGVTGTLAQPETLLLARYDPSGRLRYAGRSHPLTGRHQRELAPLLAAAARAARGREHPWPQPLPAAWSGQLPHPEPLPYLPVEPTIVAEISVDTAFEQHRWRHRVHHIRPRPDLDPAQVPSLPDAD